MAKAVQFDQSKSSSSNRKKPWSLNPERYEMKQVIGEGSYGSVYGALCKYTDRGCAIKRSRQVFEELTDCKRMLREIAILNRVNHKNVVKLYEMYLLPNGGSSSSDSTNDSSSQRSFDDIALVLEQCQYDMKKLFKADDHLDEVHSRALFFRVCQGVNYLHSVGIWHRDLKPANILLNMDCSVKICDFGLARAIGSSGSQRLFDLDKLKNDEESKKRNLTAHVVTRWYRAPELILLHEDYTESIDVWSLGCILVELLLMESRYCSKEEIRTKRGPLFPGQCCYPLSPRKDEQGNPLETDKRYADQLRVIFNHIGTPSEADYQFLSNADAKWYIYRIYAKNAQPPIWFNNRLPGVDVITEDLLKRLLMFNPSKRITLNDALAHDFFKQTRRQELKRNNGVEENYSNNQPITIPFPDEKDLTESDLRHYYQLELELSMKKDREYLASAASNMKK